METRRSGRRLPRSSAAERWTTPAPSCACIPTRGRSKRPRARRPATTRWTPPSRPTRGGGLEPGARVRFPLPMTATVREERKVLTAVFADVVGSTALAERLDPEDVKLVVGEAIARIVGEVESLGGHVKDLAGDGVLVFFGAPTTREDDAERAVRCALRIVGEMEEYAREVRRGWGAEGFGVRVGAATGAVVVGEVGAGSRVEYAAFGDTVNIAARLQSAAEPGSVLVDDATHRAVEGLFDWGEPLELDLKGKSEAVAAWPVRGVAAEGRTQRGLPGVETRLVGRSRELGLGREALEALRSGRGGVLVVSGDAGHRQDPAPERAARACGEGRELAGSRAAASRTASRCRTGRSATCCAANGSAPEPRSPSCAFASGCAGAWSSSSTARPTSSTHTSEVCSRSRSSTRRRRARRALAGGVAVADVRGRRPTVRPPHGVGAARARLRGSPLGGCDVGAAPRAASLARRGGAGAARPLAAAGARPWLLGAPRARGPRVPASAARDRSRPARGRRRTASSSPRSSRRQRCPPS